MRRVARSLALTLLLVLSTCTGKPDDSGDVALTVFLDNDATATQRDAVQQRLRSMPSVQGVALETRDQVYERSKADFQDQPDLLADLKPEYAPELVHATVTDSLIAEAIELVMAEADGVDGVSFRMADADPRPSRIGVIVRLKTSATSDQRATIHDAVRALPHATSVGFEDRSAAYERLRKRCQGKGDLTTQLKALIPHESWRFAHPLNGKGSGVSHLMTLDGVDGLNLVPVEML
ncbi:permease-like cell division protein FtsX [Micromonospora sp. NPDC049204]|uniref:permease-like cell division protein FtsX n=1 Tax=unclassified Micromonospora TaxID=2617518 RepID=UPI0033FFE0EC